MPRSTMSKAKKARSAGRAGFTGLVDEESSGLISGILTRKGVVKPPPRNFPENVKIVGQIWRVRYHSQIYADRGKRKKPSRILGFCNFSHRLIVIDPCVPRFEALDTLYHEMAHVYLRKYPGNKTYWRALQKIEEDICDIFARAFADATQNNGISG